MKGIVLAAGKGTRLYPMTKPVCKPLLPVYDKPLIYYPIAILMQAGISDIMVIVPPGETDTFRALLGDGSQYGLQITYAEQPVARGIADALLIGREFVGAAHVCRVLGANAMMVEEIMDYDNQVMEIAGNLKPSARGELEITDVNLEYLRRGQLQVIPLEKGFTWLDAGTADSLLTAGQTIKEIQDETGRYVGCLEELGLQEGWITADHVHAIGDELSMTLYGKYLQCL